MPTLNLFLEIRNSSCKLIILKQCKLSFSQAIQMELIVMMFPDLDLGRLTKSKTDFKCNHCLTVLTTLATGCTEKDGSNL